MKANELLKFLKKIKELELETEVGKVNAVFGIGAIFFILALTMYDGLLQGLALIIGIIKTAILQSNIVEECETANVPLMICLLLVFLGVCIGIVYFVEKRKESLQGKINDIDNEK